MEKLRYGVLSTASVVPRFLAALREDGSGEAVAIASRSAEKAAAKAGEWGIPKSYGSYEEMLHDDFIDVVYVASINSEHYTSCKLALERGYHVICEKPFTLASAQARELFALAAQKNRFLAEAQKAVFLPVMQRVKEIIAEGKLGKIFMADFITSSGVGYNPWLHSLEAGGGALYGGGSYPLHLAKYLLGEEITAHASMCTQGSTELDEQCVFCLRLGSGIILTSKISTNMPPVGMAVIYGSLGHVAIPYYWKARSATVHYEDGSAETLEYPCQHEMVYEVAHFNECIRKGLLQSPVMDEAMTVGTLETMEKLRAGWA